MNNLKGQFFVSKTNKLLEFGIVEQQNNRLKNHYRFSEFYRINTQYHNDYKEMCIGKCGTWYYAPNLKVISKEEFEKYLDEWNKK